LTQSVYYDTITSAVSKRLMQKDVDKL